MFFDSVFLVALLTANRRRVSLLVLLTVLCSYSTRIVFDCYYVTHHFGRGRLKAGKKHITSDENPSLV